MQTFQNLRLRESQDAFAPWFRQPNNHLQDAVR